MGSNHSPQRPRHAPCPARTAAADQAVAFLSDRLREDLARLRSRHTEREGCGPGLAAQLAVLDDVLGTLSTGKLPPRQELRLLMFGYGGHPAYDPRWTDLLLG